jgi:hypothetical protein
MTTRALERPNVKTNTDILSDKDTDEIMEMVMMIFMMLLIFSVLSQAVSPVLAQATSYYTAQSFEGNYVESTTIVDNTSHLIDVIGVSPYTPWASMDVLNYGPGKLSISLNDQTSWKDIDAGEAYTYNMIGATTRISQVYYKSDSSSSVKITGRY